MKFKGNLVSLELNMAAYKKRLHEELLEDLTRVAFVWLNKVLAEVPQWSGASRATFLQLAREISYSLAIDPKVISRESFGASHGKGKITTDPAKGLYTFTYSTDLKWLVSNEFRHNTAENDSTVFHRLRRPGPYHFQEKGKVAFEQAAKDVRLPSPWKSLKIKKHRVS
jgi:hypothetical protein